MYSIYKNNYIKYISILLILTLVLSSCGKSGGNVVKREGTATDTTTGNTGESSSKDHKEKTDEEEKEEVKAEGEEENAKKIKEKGKKEKDQDIDNDKEIVVNEVKEETKKLYGPEEERNTAINEERKKAKTKEEKEIGRREDEEDDIIWEQKKYERKEANRDPDNEIPEQPPDWIEEEQSKKNYEKAYPMYGPEKPVVEKSKIGKIIDWARRHPKTDAAAALGITGIAGYTGYNAVYTTRDDHVKESAQDNAILAGTIPELKKFLVDNKNRLQAIEKGKPWFFDRDDPKGAMKYLNRIIRKTIIALEKGGVPKKDIDTLLNPGGGSNATPTLAPDNNVEINMQININSMHRDMSLIQTYNNNHNNRSNIIEQPRNMTTTDGNRRTTPWYRTWYDRIRRYFRPETVGEIIGNQEYTPMDKLIKLINLLKDPTTLSDEDLQEALKYIKLKVNPSTLPKDEKDIVKKAEEEYEKRKEKEKEKENTQEQNGDLIQNTATQTTDQTVTGRTGTNRENIHRTTNNNNRPETVREVMNNGEYTMLETCEKLFELIIKYPTTLSDEEYKEALDYLNPRAQYFLSKDEQNELKKAIENYNKRKK